MSGELQRYLGQFTIGADRKDFTVGGSPVALTLGDYYPWGITGEVQFLEHIQAQIRALGAPYGSTLVTASNTTGLVNIADLGAVTAINWTDTTLGTLLGFAGNLSGQDNYTATNKMRYTWFPSVGLSDYPGHLADFWAPRSTTVAHRSPGGQTYSRKGNLVYDGAYAYQFLSSSEVWQEGSAWWASFESFFEDVIHEAQPFRVFPDRTLNDATTRYKTAMFSPEDGEPVGSMRDLSTRILANYNGYWELSLPLWQHVA